MNSVYEPHRPRQRIDAVEARSFHRPLMHVRRRPMSACDALSSRRHYAAGSPSDATDGVVWRLIVVAVADTSDGFYSVRRRFEGDAFSGAHLPNAPGFRDPALRSPDGSG